MSSIAMDLAALLGGVDRPGDFYTAGTCEIFAPGLDVQGVGPIALPLLPVQAEQLIGIAQHAPYGRGEQTLVDTEVRRTWQIGPERVQIRGRSWDRTLENIVGRAAEGLGVAGPVVAEFYKLLVYDEGAFFVNHRDSEKTAGMFATLVIVLPALYRGGELVIRHNGREVRLDPNSHEPSGAGFVAFYADCVHEVLPVTSGCRLTLVYNLSYRASGKQPLPPSYTRERDRLAALLGQWGGEKIRSGLPEKLIYPLEHAYTQAGLSFEALKGADAAKAATLLAAAGEAGCDVHLALVSIEESGSAEQTGGYGRYGRGRHDDDSFEVIEVDDRSETLSDWRLPAGGDPGLGPIPIVDGEVSPPDAFEEMVPDDESFQEATGNEGASFERSYRVAALVLWPRHRRLAVINQGGLQATLPYLADLTERWSQSGEDRNSSLWAEAHELSSHMLDSWPKQSWRPAKSSSDATTMLTLLQRLGDSANIDSFLENVSAVSAFDKGDGESVLQAIRLLPRPRAGELLKQIVAGNATRAFDACADLLARAAALDEFDLAPAAAPLVAALPCDAARIVEVAPWQRHRAIEAAVVVDVLTALTRIAPELAQSALDTLLAWPKTYPFDTVLVPAGLALGRTAAARTVAVERLIVACTAHLHARIAEHLEPPADWRRHDALGCTCRFCRELSVFLADPVRPTWALKSLQVNRSHVETEIRNCHCDVDTKTLRQGSPHSLFCTKNQASYERRARQRKKDLDHLSVFEEYCSQRRSSS
jgi:predicted 2-oxoglutarate/Fe(II)-dependent dioxygenase YbiX